MAVKNQTVWHITAAQCCTIPEVNITVGASDTAEVIAKEVDPVSKKKTTFTVVVRTQTTKAYCTVVARKVADFTLGQLHDWLTSSGENSLPNKNNSEVDIANGNLRLSKAGEQTPNPPGTPAP